MITEILSTDELIKKLTETKGELKDREYLITIVTPNEQVIKGRSENVYSDRFTADSLTQNQASEIVSFIVKMTGMADDFLLDEFKVILSSTDIGIAYGILDYLYSYLSILVENGAIKGPWILEDKIDYEVMCGITSKKLLLAYEMHDIFKIPWSSWT